MTEHELPARTRDVGASSASLTRIRNLKVVLFVLLLICRVKIILFVFTHLRRKP